MASSPFLLHEFESAGQGTEVAGWRRAEPDLGDLIDRIVHAGYRLGCGGGYFDRTLVAMTTEPRVIGVGYSMALIETIYPQPHDIPMDAIVTEAGVELRSAAIP